MGKDLLSTYFIGMKLFRSKSLISLVCVVLFFMIISRLTWVQVRSFSIEDRGFLSSDLLHLWSLPIQDVRSWNINVCILMFSVLAFMVRFLTNSWMTALFAVTVLLSRGALLARIGWLSWDLTMSFLVVLWFTFLAHYLRTAAVLSQLGLYLCQILACALVPSFLVLGLVLPLYRLACTWRRPKRRNLVYIPRGTLLRPLVLPMRDWLVLRDEPNRLSLWDLGVVLVSGVLVLVFSSWVAPLRTGFSGGDFLDVHYVGSFLVLGVFAFVLRSYSFLGLFLLSIFLWLSVSHVFLSVLLWMEPMILSLGCVVFVELLKIGRRYCLRWSGRSHVSQSRLFPPDL